MTSNKEQLLKIKIDSVSFNTNDFTEACLFTESVDFDAIKERLNDTSMARLLHAGIGMGTEAGEFLDQLKKHIFYGKPLDRVNLIEELGDCMYYVAVAADECGVTLQEVMRRNSKKLMKRYEGGFTEKAAVNRDLDKERDILEGN